MTEQQLHPPAPKVFVAIHNVLVDIAKQGVGKNAVNTQQNFQYRANEDVMNALAPLLAKHHLLILPTVIDHKHTERLTRSNSPALHALLKCSYTFVCPLDGSMHVVGPIYGEAMDLGDKSTNKALTTAYKYACSQSFCIPFAGDDPDAQSHEIAGASNEPEQRPGPRAESPSGPAPASGSSTRPASKPISTRPGGMFAFGKKHRDTPWNVVPTDYLEWALNADRMPQDVRARIAAELEWRDFEKAQMEAADEQQRIEREKPLSDDIPWE